jgi:hypothetical protein
VALGIVNIGVSVGVAALVCTWLGRSHRVLLSRAAACLHRIHSSISRSTMTNVACLEIFWDLYPTKIYSGEIRSRQDAVYVPATTERHRPYALMLLQMFLNIYNAMNVFNLYSPAATSSPNAPCNGARCLIRHGWMLPCPLQYVNA